MFELYGRYTNATIFAEEIEKEAVSQIQGLCNHPAFEGAKISIMSDAHAGSGCTIGTTALLREKKIIPNVVGVDIACGVFCAIFRVEGEINYKVLDDFINGNIPSGHDIRKDIHPLLRKDVIDDVRNILAELRLGEESDFLKSIGSLGGGNHFLEIDVVDDNTFALFIHTGSRNLGKKVCEYFQKKALLNIEGENTQGLKKIINNVCVNISNSREEFFIGGSEGQYVETDRSIESVNDSNKLFSINTSATPINSPTANATIIVMQNNPLPLTILSLSAMFSLEDISDVQ